LRKLYNTASLTTTRTNELWALAGEKGAEITRFSPDLAPAVAVQHAMLRIVLDATDELEDSGPDLLHVDSTTRSSRWHRGLPAFRGEAPAIPERLKTVPAALCNLLSHAGAGESAAHIADALARGEIDAGSLLKVSLARNQKAIRVSALHHGFAPDLVWMLGELASSPLAHLWHLANEFPDGSASAAWDRGYCPWCGSWPALIECLDGSRVLRCSYCAASWRLNSPRCVYCANASESFVAAESGLPTGAGGRIELCGSCGGYTKSVDVTVLTPFPLLAIQDLATMALDTQAMNLQYRRPSIVDLDAIDPPSSTGCA